MYNQKKALNDEIKRCEKELSAYEYEYDHTNDAAKRASLVKSIDFWSEKTAEAYHRLSLYEDAEDEDEGKPFDPFDGIFDDLITEKDIEEADDPATSFKDSIASRFYKTESEYKQDRKLSEEDVEALVSNLFEDDKEATNHD